MTAQTLKRRGSPLASAEQQLHVLNYFSERIRSLPTFAGKVANSVGTPLKPKRMEILQLNLGKMCNQTCKHCHVDAGPDRKEIMTQDTMTACLEALRNSQFKIVDLTGGAPEMNPHFRWLVERVRDDHKGQSLELIVRCNLTIIVSHPNYRDLPNFFKKHRIRVVSSLPFYNAESTDRQRGQGVFERSIEALRMLNQVGYGIEGSDLVLDLVYNPVGAFLPGPQTTLEADFKKQLSDRHQIRFNNLLTITNMPISRFLEYLIESDNLEGYMEKLVNSFNPVASQSVMCTNTLSVGWDGQLYDCDFNQMLDMPLESQIRTIRDFNSQKLLNREIVVNQHCYGCTAGSGSSCGGALTDDSMSSSGSLKLPEI